MDTEEILEEIIPRKLVEEFEEKGEADFSYAVSRVGRFRVNAFRQRGSIFIVMRFIPFGVPRFEDLDLPDVIGKLAREERSIILVTGTTGSGKSTACVQTRPRQPHDVEGHNYDRGSDRVPSQR